MKKSKNLIIIIGFLSFFILAPILIFIQDKPKKLPVKRDYEEIKLSGEINIVTEYNSIGYYISGDTIKGIQYELSQYIEKRSGLTVKLFLENNLENCIRKLENNEYDIIALNIPITNELKETITFTEPIFRNKYVLVQRKMNTAIDTDTTNFISNQLDLAEKIIYVPKNSPAILRIKNLAKEIAHPIYIEEDEKYTAEQLIYMVADQKIDYAVVEQDIATNNLDLFPNIDADTDISFTQLSAWALRKEASVLLDSLNNWIIEYHKQ